MNVRAEAIAQLLLTCLLSLIPFTRISQQLIVLKQALPGVDLAEIMAKQPRLLYMEGAQDKV